jgi:hypothetical protein
MHAAHYDWNASFAVSSEVEHHLVEYLVDFSFGARTIKDPETGQVRNAGQRRTAVVVNNSTGCTLPAG